MRMNLLEDLVNVDLIDLLPFPVPLLARVLATAGLFKA